MLLASINFCSAIYFVRTSLQSILICRLKLYSCHSCCCPIILCLAFLASVVYIYLNINICIVLSLSSAKITYSSFLENKNTVMHFMYLNILNKHIFDTVSHCNVFNVYNLFTEGNSHESIL